MLFTRIEARDYIEKVIIPNGFFYVYRLYSKRGDLLYIGKGQRKRVLQHFSEKPIKANTKIEFYFISRDKHLVGVVESSQLDQFRPSLNKRAGISFTILENGTYVSTNSLRRKYAKKNTGSNYDPELHARRISKALTGRKISEDVRQRMSLGQKGRIIPLEHRRKISEGRKNSDKVKQEAAKRTNPVEIDGVRYINLHRASLALGINYATLFYRMKTNREGYRVVK